MPARKPGAVRNGAPFKDWALPAAMERVRRKLANADDGDRQMVDILTAVFGESNAQRSVHGRADGPWPKRGPFPAVKSYLCLPCG
jgi:hypothetical protein